MRYLLAILLSIVCCPLEASDITLLSKSVCRIVTSHKHDGKIYASGSYSGTVIHEDTHRFIILTCAHGPYPSPIGSKASIWFNFHQGKMSPKLTGKLLWYENKPNRYRSYDKPWLEGNQRRYDVGLIELRKSAFVRYSRSVYPYPRVVQIAGSNLLHGNNGVTVGYPSPDIFPSAFSLYVRQSQNGLLVFDPPPKVGRSGSGIFNRHNQLVGVVVSKGSSKNFHENRGGGVRIEGIIRAITNYRR